MSCMVIERGDMQHQLRHQQQHPGGSGCMRTGMPDLLLDLVFQDVGTSRRLSGPDRCSSCCGTGSAACAANSGFFECSCHHRRQTQRHQRAGTAVAPSRSVENFPTSPLYKTPVNNNPISLYKNLDPKYRPVKQLSLALDNVNLQKMMMKLTICGFYYRNMTMHEARQALGFSTEGTFLLRDSGTNGFLFAVSTKTSRGTTSVRVEYTQGRFRLDSEEKLREQMPTFDCVLKLVQFYVRISARAQNKCVWLESSGRRDTPVVLTKPLLDMPLSLKDYCRRTVHKLVPFKKLPQLPKIDDQLLYYLQGYPYFI